MSRDLSMSDRLLSNLEIQVLSMMMSWLIWGSRLIRLKKVGFKLSDFSSAGNSIDIRKLCYCWVFCVVTNSRRNRLFKVIFAKFIIKVQNKINGLKNKKVIYKIAASFFLISISFIWKTVDIKNAQNIFNNPFINFSFFNHLPKKPTNNAHSWLSIRKIPHHGETGKNRIERQPSK